jgi:hypothetical protein
MRRVYAVRVRAYTTRPSTVRLRATEQGSVQYVGVVQREGRVRGAHRCRFSTSATTATTTIRVVGESRPSAAPMLRTKMAAVLLRRAAVVL